MGYKLENSSSNLAHGYLFLAVASIQDYYFG